MLEGREHLIPAQIPGAIFFGAFPLALAFYTLAGHPADGSPLAVVAESVGVVVALTGLVLAATTSYLGWPRRLIAPIARDRLGRQRGGAERTRDRRGREWRRARRRRSDGAEP